tara:strand:+ start:1113 stop:1331 length:219 start_codon:yes stop_codon:yes gene_type:complete
MRQEVTIIYNDIELIVVGEFNKGQDGSYEYPSFSCYFDCHKVLCGGQDIIDILEQNIIEDLEEEANQIIEAL